MESAIYCFKCQKKAGEMPMKIGFRSTCSFCQNDLHTCKNCKFYAPGKPNDCQVPGTDPIRDREAGNFCEEFQPFLGLREKENKGNAKRIFGYEEEKKKDFNSLFNDSQE